MDPERKECVDNMKLKANEMLSRFHGPSKQAVTKQDMEKGDKGVVRNAGTVSWRADAQDKSMQGVIQ